VTGYVAWLGEDHGSVVYFDGIDKHRVEDLLKDAPNGPLNQEDTATVLAAYGIKLWPVGRAHTPEEACALAEQFGYPIALKSTAAALRHRYDLGGVRLNIASSEELVQDFDEMVNDLERHLGSREYVISQGFDIQAMAPSGVPCVVRSQEDPLYGPVIAFGLSGDAFDLLDDVAYGIPPLTATDISQMVRSVKASPKLFGYKGLPLADVASLEELIARVSLLSDNHPRIRELELYPVIVADSGAAVVSARLTLGEGQRKDGLRRAMTSAN
jgi:acyl-CoA synthetase (NDP forming)